MCVDKTLISTVSLCQDEDDKGSGSGSSGSGDEDAKAEEKRLDELEKQLDRENAELDAELAKAEAEEVARLDAEDAKWENTYVPQGYDLLFDDDGHAYFLNTNTMATTWDRPTLRQPWKAVKDEDSGSW